MKFNKLRIFNSFIASIILNIVLMFLVVWLFTPEIREKLTSKPIEVSTVKIKNKQSPQRRISPSIRTKIALSAAHREALSKTPSVKISDLTTTFSPENELTPAKTKFPIAPELDQPVNYESKSPNFSITSKSRGSSKFISRQSFGKVKGPKRNQTFLDSLRQEAGKAPEASIGRKDGSITGHYNISLIEYEDTAEQFRNAAFGNLASAMNRWTNVKTKVLPELIPLDSRKIMKIPLIYIAARDAFAFSEEERANLHSYLKNGGTLLFSNLQAGRLGYPTPVDNSIKFELWKILSKNIRFIDLAQDEPLCRSIFEFDEHPLHEKGKLYGIKRDGQITVIYDVAGYGRIWAQNKSNEDELKFGVNLLVYVLINSPIVSRQP